jgi:hypothetical protein
MNTHRYNRDLEIIEMAYLKSTAQGIEKNDKEQHDAPVINAITSRGKFIEHTSQDERYQQVSKNGGEEKRHITSKTLEPTFNAETDLHGD